MSELQIPRHRAPSILALPNGKRRLRFQMARAMLDLSGQTTYRMMKAEMPDPGRRRTLYETTEKITEEMNPTS